MLYDWRDDDLDDIRENPHVVQLGFSSSDLLQGSKAVFYLL